MTLLKKAIKAIMNPRLAMKIAAGRASGAAGRALAAVESKEFYGTTDQLRSAADAGYYVKFVRKASTHSKTFAKFKRDRHYIAILEHVTKSQGEDYLKIVTEESPELLKFVDKFRENDLIGSPFKYEFSGVGTFSPTTLRYMKVASDLRCYFGDLTGFKVAEIGCGYGGQLLILEKIWKLGSCTMFDMDPVLALISRYLESHLLRTAYHPTTINRFASDDFDLVISNYAFSELPAALQRTYIEKVLSRAKRGYLTMNSGLGGSFQEGKLTIDDLRGLLPKFEIIDERPLTGSYNYIIAWGRKPKSGTPSGGS
jgi:putative sugar O-methyltransferase